MTRRPWPRREPASGDALEPGPREAGARGRSCPGGLSLEANDVSRLGTGAWMSPRVVPGRRLGLGGGREEVLLGRRERGCGEGERIRRGAAGDAGAP